MKHLTDISHGNIHDKHVIDINSNSIDSSNHPKKLVDYDESNCYISERVTNKYAIIYFDFKDKSIQPTNYTIRSCRDSDCPHLRNWVIEVSNNGDEWIEIDSRRDDSNLNGDLIDHEFRIQKQTDQFYRFIRIRQTGNSWSKTNNKRWLIIRNFELYGKLKL